MKRRFRHKTHEQLPLNKSQQTRLLIARKAAGIIVRQGIQDFDLAKQKAAKSLGITLLSRNAMPTHEEVQQAIREHADIFENPTQSEHLLLLRQKAYRAMKLLKEFSPLLTGMVLDGTATQHTAIRLHAFASTIEEVMIFLINHQIPYDIGEQPILLISKQIVSFPMLRIYLAQTPIEITVFPENHLKYAPRCTLSGDRQVRANLEEVAKMVGAL